MKYKRKRLIRAALQKAEAKRKQTARQAESAADTEQQTPEEYAQTVVTEKTAQAAESLQGKALDTGRISYRQFRILQEKRQRVPTTHAAQPAETENTPLAQSADRRETGKRQRFRQRALDKREVKISDSYHDKMQALKRQHLTRETARRHLQKQAGGTVLGSGVRLPDTVPVFSGGGIRQDQRDILHQLLSEKMRPSLLALCGGIAVADGELCWPLPGHTYISCHFGEVDAFGNAGHRGTDIPAPEGTPILAAHSGTVLVSGWNDSYGNQVLLDNGAGLSTRYAHMTQTAVTAGEVVTAGQVIGYVGSTGDSTGNHLHSEVMQNGVRMNPLELVFGQ